MPIRLAIPLPGPFVWTRRTGIRRPRASRFHSPWYWLLGIWLLELSLVALWAVTVGAVWLAWHAVKLTAALTLVLVGLAVERIQTGRPVGKHRKPRSV